MVKSHSSVGIVCYHKTLDSLLVVRQFRPAVGPPPLHDFLLFNVLTWTPLRYFAPWFSYCNHYIIVYNMSMYTTYRHGLLHTTLLCSMVFY